MADDATAKPEPRVSSAAPVRASVTRVAAAVAAGGRFDPFQLAALGRGELTGIQAEPILEQLRERED